LYGAAAGRWRGGAWGGGFWGVRPNGGVVWGSENKNFKRSKKKR